MDGDHEDDFLLVVDFVEEPMSPDSKAPGFGLVGAEFPDVLPEMGLPPEAGVDEGLEFSEDFFIRGTEIAPKILLELCGLENAELTQRSGLSACGPGRSLP